MMEGSVAERGGVRIGDTILEINAKPCAGRSREGALEMLSSAEANVDLVVLNSSDLIESAQQLRRLCRRPSNLNMV